MRQVAIGAALVLALAACGTDDEPSATPSVEPTSASTSLTPSVELPESTPTVEPATGPRIGVHGVSVRVPQRWKRGFRTPFGDTAKGPQGALAIAVIGGDPMSLGALMKRDIGATGPVTEVREHPTVSVGGFSAYHYTARTSHLDVRHAYGLYDAGYRIWIHFNLADRFPERKRQQLVDAVMATYESEG